jgi:hypothetical protein
MELDSKKISFLCAYFRKRCKHNTLILFIILHLCGSIVRVALQKYMWPMPCRFRIPSYRPCVMVVVVASVKLPHGYHTILAHDGTMTEERE